MPFPVIAPTLAPLRPGALMRGVLAAALPSAGTDHLTASLEAMFGGVTLVLYESGRAALAEAFRVSMRATGRRRVVLPAYTSYSVAAAAASAGVEPVLCDVDPATLALDPAALRACVDERTAVVLLGNLFGWPEPTADLAWLDALGAVVIDDAAQALGARERGRLVGGRGRLGVLSFGRGKCVTLGEGGALLVHDPALRAHTSAPAASGRGVRALAMALAVSLSRSRLLLGGLSRLPGVRLGESHFEPDFEARSPAACVRAMASGLPVAVERARAVRHQVASRWREGLSACAAPLRLPPPAPGSDPAFLRYPVLAPSPAARERYVAALAEAGFGYVRSFPLPLRGIPAFARLLVAPTDVPGAETLASGVIALPCHVGIGPRDISRAARALQPLGEASGAA